VIQEDEGEKWIREVQRRRGISGFGGRGRELRWFGIESEKGLGSWREDRRVSPNREDSEGKGELFHEIQGWDVFRSISV